MAENLCMSCSAACCKGPLIIALDDQEQEMMQAAGTQLITIAEPIDYDRTDVPYPIGAEIDEEQLTLHMPPEKEVETEPLPAGFGRYAMIGSCGNLTEILGVQQCGIYNRRPKACRDFNRGSRKCHLLRMMAGVEKPSLLLSALDDGGESLGLIDG